MTEKITDGIDPKMIYPMSGCGCPGCTCAANQSDLFDNDEDENQVADIRDGLEI